MEVLKAFAQMRFELRPPGRT